MLSSFFNSIFYSCFLQMNFSRFCIYISFWESCSRFSCKISFYDFRHLCSFSWSTFSYVDWFLAVLGRFTGFKLSALGCFVGIYNSLSFSTLSLNSSGLLLCFGGLNCYICEVDFYSFNVLILLLIYLLYSFSDLTELEEWIYV